MIGIHQSIFHSKGSTRAGLTSFLETLGDLYSCFILPGSGFLYAGCGITSLDNRIGIHQSISHSTTIIHSLDLCILYSNPDTDKIKIFKDNRKKSGVYI